MSSTMTMSLVLSPHGTKPKACHNVQDDRPCSSYRLSPPASLINPPSPLHPISRNTPHLYHPTRANQRLLLLLLRHHQTTTTSSLPCRISVLFVRSCKGRVSANIFVYLTFFAIVCRCMVHALRAFSSSHLLCLVRLPLAQPKQYIHVATHWVGDGFAVHPVFANKAFTEELSPFLMVRCPSPLSTEQWPRPWRRTASAPRIRDRHHCLRRGGRACRLGWQSGRHQARRLSVDDGRAGHHPPRISLHGV